MEKKYPDYLHWGSVLFVILNILGMWRFHTEGISQNWFTLSTKIRIAEITGWVFLLLLICFLVYLRTAKASQAVVWTTTPYRGPGGWRVIALGLLPVLLVLYPILMFGQWSTYFLLDWTRQMIFAWLVILTSGALAVWRRKSWAAMLPIAALVMAVIYHLVTYFPDVTNYPFALGWSETTRYYVASTFFDQRIYGMDLPLVFRDFTRYLMQAVPFLVKGSPLWVHRLWQVILRFGSTYFAGYVLARRYKVNGLQWAALFVMWAGLYYFQGPVFYNLIVNALLVYWLIKPDGFWRTLVAVAGISVWAGLSRVNWIPMPGLMAAAFYLLEKPLKEKDFKALAGYLLKPAVWVLVGTGVGMAVQQGYAMISGNPEEIYYASFTSYLLWDRLFPNPSYRLGILPHVLLLTGPLLVYFGIALAKWRKRWHLIRPLGLVAILMALLAGGLVVSVKIGGGTNLHNMDVYLVILLLIAAEIFFGKAVDTEGRSLELRMPDWLKIAVFAVPIIFVISYSGGKYPTRDMAKAEQDLSILQEYVDQATADGGEVLFISQRHLITFGLIENVTLVHEHEKLLLQEMVMSRNREYLDRFAKELTDQRYALIIHDPLPRVFKNAETTPLADENNVVLKEISPLFTCAYQEVGRLLDGSLSLFLPADEVTCGEIEE